NRQRRRCPRKDGHAFGTRHVLLSLPLYREAKPRQGRRGRSGERLLRYEDRDRHLRRPKDDGGSADRGDHPSPLFLASDRAGKRDEMIANPNGGYDLAVIGAGSAGFSAAIGARGCANRAQRRRQESRSRGSKGTAP